MIVLSGVAGQASLRDCVAAAARFQAAAMLAVAGADVPTTLRAAGEDLAEGVDAVASDAPGFVDALTAAWLALALEGALDTLPDLIEEALADRIESDAGWVSRSIVAAAYAVAVLRPDYASRQDARRARERFAAAVRPVVEQAGDALGAAVAAWLSGLTGEAALTLSRRAATLAPVVRVETALSLSAIRAAYDLYGDANRAGELVDRNRVATPALMPAVFEAVKA